MKTIAGLTLCMLGRKLSRLHVSISFVCFFCLFFFSNKIGFDISFKLPPKASINFFSAEFAQSVVKVRFQCIDQSMLEMLTACLNGAKSGSIAMLARSFSSAQW